METKASKMVYAGYQDLSDVGMTEKPKSTGVGLLSPTKNFNKQTSDNRLDQPAYRVAEYVKAIRNQREALKNG